MASVRWESISVAAVAGCCVSGVSAQLSGLTLNYVAYLDQTGPTPTSPLALPAIYGHSVTAVYSATSASADGISEVELSRPNSTFAIMDGSGTFRYSNSPSYATRAAMLNAWPTGAYRFEVTDGDLQGTVHTLNNTLPAGLFSDEVPTFTLATVQSLVGMDPRLPRTIEVNPFTVDPQANGQFSGVGIYNKFGFRMLGSTAWSSFTTVGQPTATRTIPAHALQPNTEYYAVWHFGQRVYNPPIAGVAYNHVSFEHRTMLSFRTGPSCPADMGVQGGVPGSDTLLNNNDFIVFIDYFFASNPRADLGVQGGQRGSDGVHDNNDFIAFIDLFFAGC